MSLHIQEVSGPERVPVMGLNLKTLNFEIFNKNFI